MSDQNILALEQMVLCANQSIRVAIRQQVNGLKDVNGELYFDGRFQEFLESAGSMSCALAFIDKALIYVHRIKGEPK